MSVYIEGMEMPTGCLECDFCNPFVDEPYCRRLLRRTPLTTRRKDCPLVPVPQHGRLIDANEFCRNMATLVHIDPITAAGIISFVKRAPTIIEAEEEQK